MIKRGEIYFAELSPFIGSEQGGKRPVLILQNDVGNKYSPTVIIAAITTKLEKANLPTHIFIPGQTCGLMKDSIVLLEQLRTIDKSRLLGRIGQADSKQMDSIEKALIISLGLNSQFGE